MRALVFASAVAALACGACGGGNGEGRGAAHGQAIGGVIIVILPPPDQLPFDPRSARLAQATQELTLVVGHPISFELEASLLSEWRSSFEEQLITSIENAAKDLSDLKKAAPRVFDRAAPMIGKIACHYQATAKWPNSVLDPDARTISITEPPNGHALVPRGIVHDAVLDEFDDFLDRTYRTKEPDEIPPDERAAYFDYLTRIRPGKGLLRVARARDRAGAQLTGMALVEARAEVLLRVARLGEILGKSVDPLAVAVRAWLTDQARWFIEAQYETSGEQIARLPPDSAWRRAEAVYVRWLTTNASALTDREMVGFARIMFPARASCRESDPCLDTPASFPGFDRFAFGLAVVDAWRSEGRPREGEGDHFELIDSVVCPHITRPDGKRDRNRSCSEAFYQYSAATEASRKRLVDALVQRHDPMLVDEVFTNLDRVPPDRVIAVWRALEQHPPEWQAASHTVLEHLLANRSFAPAVLEEANRMWKRSPDKRGVALYAIATSKQGYDRHYADRDFADFPKRYGEPVSEDVLRQLLELGPRAVPLVPIAWPALGKGFSRMDLIAPRLDAFLSLKQGAGDGEPSKTLHALVARICEGNDARDLARFHSALQERVRGHAEDAAPLATLLVDTSRCKPASKEQ